MKGHTYLVHDKKKLSKAYRKPDKDEETREFKSKFFNCEFCDSSFALEPHLKSHISSDHKGKKLDTL